MTVTDPYYAAAILDLERGQTAINNAHAVFRMHNIIYFAYIVYR